MSEHTPEQSERWRTHIDSTGTTYLMVGSEIVGEMHGHRDQKTRDARRIVACVNGCWDMDDDEIAQIMAESKGIGMRLSQKEYAISELNRLLCETVQQREALLSALIGVRNELGQEWSRKAFDKADEAIAKARGKS